MAKGVIFSYAYTYYLGDAIHDIDVDDTVDTVEFESAQPNQVFSVRLHSVKKQFPHVKKLILPENLRNIEISNYMFPNVVEVESKSRNFLSGQFLVNQFNHLFNSFCRQPDEVLDLKNICCIEPYALEGCKTRKMINMNQDITLKQCALHGSALLLEDFEGKFENGIQMFSNTVIDIEKNSDIRLQDCSFYDSCDFSKAGSVFLTDFNLVESFKDSYPAKLIIQDDTFYPLSHVVYQLKKFNIVDIQNQWYKLKGNLLYTKDEKILVHVPFNYKHVSIADGTTELPADVMASCLNLTSIHIPDSVKYIGYGALCNCPSLESIDIDAWNFTANASLFRGCSSLKKIDISGNFTCIPRDMFTNSGLQEVIFHEGLQAIDSRAFGFTPIKSVTFPSTLRFVESGNFQSVSQIFVKGNKLPHGVLQSILKDSAAEEYSIQNSLLSITFLDVNKTIYIPKQIMSRSLMQLESLLCDFPIDAIDTIENNAFDIPESSYLSMYNSSQVSQASIINCAIAFINATGSQNARSFLKKKNISILNHLFKRCNEEDFISFIALDILTPRMLDKVLAFAQEQNMTMLISLILDKKQKSGCSKKKFVL